VRNKVAPIGCSSGGSESVIDGCTPGHDAEMSFDIDPDSSLDVVESQLRSESVSGARGEDDCGVTNMDVDVDGHRGVAESQLPFSIDPSQLQIRDTQSVLSLPIKTPTQNRGQKALLSAVTSTPGQSQSPERLHLQPNPPGSPSTLDISNLTSSRSPEVMFSGASSGRGAYAMVNASQGSDMSVSQADPSSSQHEHQPRNQNESPSRTEPSVFVNNLGVSSQSGSTPLKFANGMDGTMKNVSSEEYDSGFVYGDGASGESELQTQAMGMGAFGASWDSDG